jgi:N-acetylmuramic acid 6-phosphate etherase
VQLATGASDDEVDRALVAANGSAKVAIVSLIAGIGADSATERLERSGGNVREALR